MTRYALMTSLLGNFILVAGQNSSIRKSLNALQGKIVMISFSLQMKDLKT